MKRGIECPECGFDCWYKAYLMYFGGGYDYACTVCRQRFKNERKKLKLQEGKGL